MTTVSTDRPHRPHLLPHADTVIAFATAMHQWEQSLRRPDMEERDRVAGALLAYQSQLDALEIARFGGQPLTTAEEIRNSNTLEAQRVAREAMKP